MALVVTEGGLVRLANEWQEYLSTLTLHLYTNDYTPTTTSEVDDFEEATFEGYEEELIDTWGTAYLNPDNIAEIDADVYTFTVTSLAILESVYGYYITDPEDNVISAERRPGPPVAMNVIGKSYYVRPSLTLQNPT